MLRRKIYQQLCDWKQNSNGHTALLIDGARRVGKSYIVEQFAMQEYKSYIMIDFGNAPQEILDLFINESSDLDLFFAKLAAYYSTILYKRQSLIVFDEVQQFPRARQLIKYFVADGRFDFLEAGSLIRLKKNTEYIIISSEKRIQNISLFRLKKNILKCFSISKISKMIIRVFLKIFFSCRSYNTVSNRFDIDTWF